MKKGLKKIGAPSKEELNKYGVYPSREQFKKGKTIVIECIEEIPCNPCETSCPKGAIYIGDSIVSLPKIDHESCISCGICIAKCPGLAIYMKNYNYSKDEASITFPYEFLPVPKINEEVNMIDRQGNIICNGVIINIDDKKENDKTLVITAKYSKEYFDDVVNIKVKNT